eukprot:Awhi_evm1s9705
MISSESFSTNHLKENHNSVNSHLLPFQNFSTLVQNKKKKTRVTECSLCLDGFHFYEKKYRTKCNHKYHFACLKGMSDILGKRNEKQCPLCRDYIERDWFTIRNIEKLEYADWDGEYKRIRQNTQAEEIQSRRKIQQLNEALYLTNNIDTQAEVAYRIYEALDVYNDVSCKSLFI